MTEKELIEQYKEIHNNSKYGTSSHNILKYFEKYIIELNPDSILDYACGQGNLISKLSAKVKDQYDPAIEKYNKFPNMKYDLVINTDMLEHILEEDINNILERIKSVSKGNVIFVISCIKASKILPNGMNAHVTIKPPKWWKNKISEHFKKVNNIDVNPNNRNIAIFRTW